MNALCIILIFIKHKLYDKNKCLFNNIQQKIEFINNNTNLFIYYNLTNLNLLEKNIYYYNFEIIEAQIYCNHYWYYVNIYDIDDLDKNKKEKLKYFKIYYNNEIYLEYLVCLLSCEKFYSIELFEELNENDSKQNNTIIYYNNKIYINK